MNYIIIFLLTFLVFKASSNDECMTANEILTEECKEKIKEFYVNKEEGFLNEEYIEDKWTVKVIQHEKDKRKWAVYASVNGKVTNGDRLRVRILTEDENSCEYGNTITSFYTTISNAKTLNFSNDIIPAKFKGEVINIKLLFANRFLSGYSVTIDMGWNHLDSIKEYFQGLKKVDLKLLDSGTIKIKEYFDINENTFSLNALNEALERAKKECIKIIKHK